MTSLKYQDGTFVKFGDIVTIGVANNNKLITVQDDGETLILHDFISTEKHALLVCGNQKLGESQEFYLTCKYNKGFLYFFEGVFKSGVPWTERTTFNVNKLKTALGCPLDQELVFTKIADAE